MPRGLSIFVLSAALLASTAGLTAAQTVTIGTPGSGFVNPIPFGQASINGGYGVTRYQQVYSASAFSGPLLINTISFFNAIANRNYGSATFTFDLSTTSAAVGALSQNLASNVGFDSQLFFSAFLSGDASNPVFIGTPFLYDPSRGNLLLDIQITEPTSNIGGAFFDLDLNNPLSSRAFDCAICSPDGGPTIVANDGGSLTTQFSGTTPVAVTPEPITMALLATGLAGIGGAGLFRRRRDPDA